MSKHFFAAACILVASSFSAFADDMMPAKAMGSMMVDAKGMTLYTFDKDSAGKSACVGGCATNWPPLSAGADAKASGDWSVIQREGGMQWAYKGHPLYTFIKDKATGDKSGDGLMGAWHVATP